MNTHYWPYGNTCHELYTRGPCVQGHIYVYNHTKQNTECVCAPELVTNYHHETKQCYELETTGPCKPGQIFTFDPASLTARCKCIEGYIKWEPTGHCYREYTKGPCQPGYMLQPREFYRTLEQDHFLLPGYILTPGTWDNTGECIQNLCKGGELYDPDNELCYPVGHKGPCPEGKLWVYERATSLRGICYCDPQLVGYWPPNKACYQIGERGPCPERHMLSYDVKSAKLTCKCDYRNGYVNWRNQCVKIMVDQKIHLTSDILRFRDDLTDEHKNTVRVAARGNNDLFLETQNSNSSRRMGRNLNLGLDSTSLSRKNEEANIEETEMIQSSLQNPEASVSSLVTDSYSVVTINNQKITRPENQNANSKRKRIKTRRPNMRLRINRKNLNSNVKENVQENRPIISSENTKNSTASIKSMSNILDILFADDSNTDKRKKPSKNQNQER